MISELGIEAGAMGGVKLVEEVRSSRFWAVSVSRFGEVCSAGEVDKAGFSGWVVAAGSPGCAISAGLDVDWLAGVKPNSDSTKSGSTVISDGVGDGNWSGVDG